MVEHFEPRKIVNGKMLRSFIGENISIMLCVESEEGKILKGMSTDDQVITANLSDVVDATKGDWVEVIGKPDGLSVIRASEVSNLHFVSLSQIFCKRKFIVGHFVWW